MHIGSACASSHIQLANFGVAVSEAFIVYSVYIYIVYGKTVRDKTPC